MIKEGYFTLSGKQYFFYVVNGKRFIDGKTVDEFIDSLDTQSLCDVARLGFEHLKAPARSAQGIANDLHQIRNN